MEQARISQRIRRWWAARREAEPRGRTSTLQLVNLQERFGPSALQGLADTAALFTIATPVAQVESITTERTTTHTAHQDAFPNTILPHAEPVLRTATPPPALVLGDTPLVNAEWTLPDTTEPWAYNVPDVTPAATPTTGAATTSTDVSPQTPTPNIVATSAAPPSLPTPALALVAPPQATTPTVTTPPVAVPTVPSSEPPDDGTANAIEDVGVSPAVLDDTSVEQSAWSDNPEASFDESLEQDADAFEKAQADAHAEAMVPPAAGGPVLRLETTATEPLPKVTASVPAKGTSTLTESIRLARPATENTPVDIHYELTAYRGSMFAQQQGTAVIPANARHVDVPTHVNGFDGRPEIVTLHIRPSAGYEIAHATATLRLNSEGQALSDAALFAAFRVGHSQPAFQQLVERHHAAVFRMAFQVLGNRADAEDVSQLAFLVLARQEMTIHTSLHYWLQKVTRNASIALLRAKSRRLRYETEAAKPADTLSMDELHTMRDELHVALAHLPSHLSEAVRLRYLEGWTQQEAAAIVGCPRGTLSQRASQGLQTLRELMAREQRDAG